jgi:hypothetical protein
MARSRTLVTAAALVAGALSLSGCYGDKPASPEASGLALLSAEPIDTLETAAEKAGEAKSVRVAVEGTVSGRRIQSQGAVAFSPRLVAELTTPGPAAAPITVRLVGTTAYAQIPPEYRERAGGKTWLKADLASVAPILGFDADELTSRLQNADPAAHAKALLASGDLKVVGEETVDGARTVHYAGSTPVAKYLQNLPDEARAAVERRMQKAGAAEVRTDLWVDESYQVRKAKAVLGDSDLTMRFTDHGQPVEVAEPPAADTADLATLIQGATR